MKYPSQEVRKSRAVFTGKLQSILRRLDGCATTEITSSFLGRRSTSQVTVEEVWVVGSYARGASACGDLDLVVHATGESATSAAVNSKLLGKLPDVRIYLGNPDHNSSGIVFSEAVKVWESGMDWRAALQAIPENSAVTHFPRKTDGLPLRQEQLRIGVGVAEEVIDAKENGLITWKFIPLDALQPTEFNDRQLCEQLEWVDMSQAKRRLLPYVQGYLNTLRPPMSYAGRLRGDVIFKDGTWILLGCGLPNYDLLNHPGIARMAVMPELSTRGPNGIWVLERGPAHPLTKVFTSNVGTWLVGRDGAPQVSHHMGEHEHDWATGVEAFENEAAARAHITQMYGQDDVEECGPLPEPMYVAGADYLAALSGVEVIEYVCGETVVAFTRDAARITRDYEPKRPGTRSIPQWFEEFFSTK